MATHQGYAHPELLAEPDWLWEHRDDPKVRVIDCASLEKYRRAHIPGAVGLPVHVWIKETEGGVYVMGSEAFADLMGQLGVTNDTTVVTYDDWISAYATRLWWVLKYYGHSNAKVLNGGWQRWVSEGRPVTFRETVVEPGHFTPRPDESIMCRHDYLMSKVDEPGVQILNVLPETFYRGIENPFGNKRVGHIPGSRNIPSEWFLTDDDRHVFKPAAELQAILTEAGLSPTNESIIHCHAGVRTTVGFFVLSLLGWDRVRAYDASMAEWANRDDTALVVE
jgi:thiosulfate/3-mercaptopyruvate sulfurtransferase